MLMTQPIPVAARSKA